MNATRPLSCVDRAARAVGSRAILALLLALPAVEAMAQGMFTVGADAACSTNAIQAAINAADDGYTIRIARNASWTAQALTINGKSLRLVGGWDDCSSAAAVGGTVLSGQGGASDSVITIRGSADVTLENLTIIRGDEVFDGYGGGVDVRGNGTLEIINSGIAQNYAGYGGGISAIGEGGNLALVLRSGTVVQLNTAQFSGGGIRLEGTANLRATEAQTWIASNQALGIDPSNNQPLFGSGGGVQILTPASADIGSPGFGNSGVIFGNSARYGGGIAISGNVDSPNFTVGRLRVFTTDPARATRIHGNSATQSGGGIYVTPDASLFDTSSAQACLWDVRVDDNHAQQGAALYADSRSSGTLGKIAASVHLNALASDPALPPSLGFSSCAGRPAGLGAVACATDVPCNTFDDNFAEDSNNNPSGAVVLVQDEGLLVLRRVSISGSFAEQLVRATAGARVRLHDLLAAGGNLTGNAILVDSSQPLVLEDSSIARNFIGAASVIATAGPLAFARNIVWQPGRRLAQDGAAVTVTTSIVNDLTGLPPGPEALVLEPRFVDPFNNDLRLRAASPAVDHAPVVAEPALDRDGAPRNRDLPIKPNYRGARDIGALERQSIAPLVLNADFDVDLRLWEDLAAGASNHDTAQNATGAVGSGSIAVNTTTLVNSRATVREQCIHLPGPGAYQLNGFGRTTGSLGATRDLQVLRWEFRVDGSESCGAGAATRAGEVTISSSNSWQQAANPPSISVDASEWTSNSSILVQLVVVDRSISGTPTAIGWFDGIRLDASPLQTSDELFADGFE